MDTEWEQIGINLSPNPLMFFEQLPTLHVDVYSTVNFIRFILIIAWGVLMPIFTKGKVHSML